MTITEVLAAIDQGLSVLKTIADTPGVNMIPYVSTISGVIGAIQAAERAGKNIAPYVTRFIATFGKNATIPTQADLDALNADIAALEAKADAPLPAAESGEPD